MSIREAFHLAQCIGTRVVVPMHWDMFGPNSTHRREIELMTELLAPPFDVVLRPERL
jgi:L-ascorbate metabolism protein UlaG (beta-lactamase superfamily)